MSDYYDRKGNPLTLVQWGVLFEDREYKIVVQTELTSGKWISTVWLGLDHGGVGSGILIFETMIFSSKGDSGREEYCDRYGSEEEAWLGHLKCLARDANLLSNEDLIKWHKMYPTDATLTFEIESRMDVLDAK